MLLDGVNHIATLSHDAARLGAFYAAVFDAEIGETVPHGQDGEETMTVFRIGPHTELNVFTVPSSDEADRQTPMWHRGRLDHFGLHAASPVAQTRPGRPSPRRATATTRAWCGSASAPPSG